MSITEAVQLGCLLLGVVLHFAGFHLNSKEPGSGEHLITRGTIWLAVAVVLGGR